MAYARIPYIPSSEPLDRGVILIIDQQMNLDCLIPAIATEFPTMDVLGASSSAAAQIARISWVKLSLVGGDDHSLADAGFREDLKRLRKVFADSPIALVVHSVDQPMVQDAVSFGIKGIILRSTPLPMVMCAMRVVLSGGCYYASASSSRPSHAPLPDGAQSMPIGDGGYHEPEPASSAEARLPVSEVAEHGFTVREKDVLRRLRQGRANKWIASELKLSENTVKIHLRNIMRKLGARNRTQAALLAQEIWSRGAVCVVGTVQLLKHLAASSL